MQVQVMEFATVALARNEDEPCQPENWVIDRAALLVEAGPALQVAADGGAGGAIRRTCGSTRRR